MRLALAALLVACKPEPTQDVLLPDADAATFVSAVDNPYFPLPVGATWVLQASTPEGLERDEVEVLSDARTVNGVPVVVVRDTVYLDGAVIEDTWDWFVQDDEGNVWYVGEDTCEYEGDECVNTGGSWEWGVDGALPGFAMPADPAVDGQPYYQEYYVGEAEDVGEVVETGVSIDVPAGSFTDCIRTHDTSTLDTGLSEYKIYCPGVGNVHVDEGSYDVELVEHATP